MPDDPESGTKRRVLAEPHEPIGKSQTRARLSDSTKIPVDLPDRRRLSSTRDFSVSGFCWAFHRISMSRKFRSRRLPHSAEDSNGEHPLGGQFSVTCLTASHVESDADDRHGVQLNE